MQETKGPVIITLARHDYARRALLERKLKEYRRRYQRYAPPECQMDTIVKMELVERLLRDGSVNTWDLSRELNKKYDFDAQGLRDFQSACGVIHDYVRTGGQNVVQQYA